MENDAVLEHLKTLDRTKVTLGQVVQYIRDNTPPPSYPNSSIQIVFYIRQAFKTGIHESMELVEDTSLWDLPFEEAVTKMRNCA